MQDPEKNSLSAHNRTTLLDYIFPTKMYQQLDRNLLNSNTSSRCRHNMVNFGPLTAEIRWRVWGTLANFNGFSRLGFGSAATSFTGGQPSFARCLAASWAGTLYIYIFRGFCLVAEFCHVLCVQVLHSPILTALLHSIRPVAISQTLRHDTGNGITELSQRAPPIFGWVTIMLGIGPQWVTLSFRLNKVLN